MKKTIIFCVFFLLIANILTAQSQERNMSYRIIYYESTFDTLYATVMGTVTDVITGLPIEGADIGGMATSGPDGTFSFQCPAGCYWFQVSADGYWDSPLEYVCFSPYWITVIDIYLMPIVIVYPVPTNLNVEIIENTAHFTWNEPTYGFFITIIGYNVFLNDTLMDTTIIDTEYVFTDLIYGQSYTAGVSAVYNFGESDTVEFEFVFTGESTDNQIDNFSIVLYNNKPNPFKQQTMIGFSLKVEANVVLEIFNTKGQKIRFF